MSTPTKQDAIRNTTGVRDALKKGNFTLEDGLSNSSEFLAALNPRAQELAEVELGSGRPRCRSCMADDQWSSFLFVLRVCKKWIYLTQINQSELGPGRSSLLKSFASHLIGENQTLTQPGEWWFVQGSLARGRAELYRIRKRDNSGDPASSGGPGG